MLFDYSICFPLHERKSCYVNIYAFNKNFDCYNSLFEMQSKMASLGFAVYCSLFYLEPNCNRIMFSTLVVHLQRWLLNHLLSSILHDHLFVCPHPDNPHLLYHSYVQVLLVEYIYLCIRSLKEFLPSSDVNMVIWLLVVPSIILVHLPWFICQQLIFAIFSKVWPIWIG